MINTEKLKKDFAILNGNRKVIYFDNACVSLKPEQVVKKMNEYYNEYTACAGRSQHRLGRKTTEEVLSARREIASFFNAKKAEEIIFTRNTTEGINLIANSLGLKAGDKVLTSDKEHNSNLVPWIVLSKTKGIKHEIFRFGDLEDFKKKISGTKLVSIVQTSNLDGTSQDVKEMIKIAHSNNALVLIDAAQSAPHKPVDVRKMDADFMACSGHKMLGPSGIGILYGKYELLEKLSQFLVGGDTVKNTTYDSFIGEDVPERFEAGLQDYGGIIGLGEALRYLKRIGLENVEKHEQELNKRLSEGLSKLGIEIIGGNDYSKCAGIVSFNVKGMDAHEVALMLDSFGICVRSGMHCVHSWFNANKIKGSVRASLYFYNTTEEVDFFLEKMKNIVKLTK